MEKKPTANDNQFLFLGAKGARDCKNCELFFFASSIEQKYQTNNINL